MVKCAVCSSAFEKKKPWQLYCSEPCRRAEMNGRKRGDRATKYCKTCRKYLPMDQFVLNHRSCRACEALRDAGQKRCRGCLCVKPLSEFYDRAGRTSGSMLCKPCSAEKSREWNQRPEVRLRVRDRHLRARFGISAEDYDELLASQGGVCAICADPPGDVNLHVDHDHRCCQTESTCGKCIRGLLCYRCNTALGALRESAEIAESAASYLRRNREVAR